VLESCNFGYKPHLSQIGVPHAQKFEILIFLLKLRSKKNLKSVIKLSKKLDGSKFGKRCLLGIYSELFFRFGKF
jgi:hypothetical protein